MGSTATYSDISELFDVVVEFSKNLKLVPGPDQNSMTFPDTFPLSKIEQRYSSSGLDVCACFMQIFANILPRKLSLMLNTNKNIPVHDSMNENIAITLNVSLFVHLYDFGINICCP